MESHFDSNLCTLSRGAYDHIRNKLGFGYEYLGEHDVKNIKQPVRVYRVLTSQEDAGKLIGDEPKSATKPYRWLTIIAATILLTLIGYQLFQKMTAPEFEIASLEKMAFKLPAKPSIVVLPFTKAIEYRTGFIAFFIVTIVRATANLFRNNVLKPEQAENFPFRAP